MLLPPIVIIIIILVAAFLLFHFIPIGLWFLALFSKVYVSLFALIGMRLRKIPPKEIVQSLIIAHKAGLNKIKREELETHYMAGGHVERVISALVAA